MRPNLYEVLADHLSHREFATLTNGLATAEQRYREITVGFAALYAFGGLTDDHMVTPRGAYLLAEQFLQQADDVERLLDRVQGDEDGED